MRKLLLSATVLALAAFPAFAHQPARPQASTMAGSAAAVGSLQGTNANAGVAGNGAVIVGAVSGNYTAVGTRGTAMVTPGKTMTTTNATQLNIGGTIAGGYSQVGKGRGNQAGGSAGGMQASGDLGGSFAIGAGQSAMSNLPVR
jgi:hypothetical protein